MAQPSTATFDLQVRQFIYDHLLKASQTPTAAETAAALGSSTPAIKAAYQRLAEAHVVNLQTGGEILMAHPFSAVPTAFQVEAGGRSWWGNCIWDALGILALLKEDGQIRCSCGDCNESMIVTIKAGSLVELEGLIHFAIPARDWWRDVVYT